MSVVKCCFVRCTGRKNPEEGRDGYVCNHPCGNVYRHACPPHSQDDTVLTLSSKWILQRHSLHAILPVFLEIFWHTWKHSCFGIVSYWAMARALGVAFSGVPMLGCMHGRGIFCVCITGTWKSSTKMHHDLQFLKIAHNFSCDIHVRSYILYFFPPFSPFFPYYIILLYKNVMGELDESVWVCVELYA